MRILNTGAQDVGHLAYLPDGRVALHLSGDGVCIWDGGPTCLVIAPTPGPATSLAVSPDGRWLAWCAGGAFVGVRRSNGTGPRHRLEVRLSAGRTLDTCAFSPDGRTLAAAGGRLAGWSVGDWRPLPQVADGAGHASWWESRPYWNPSEFDYWELQDQYDGLAFAPGSAAAAVGTLGPPIGHADWRVSLWDTAAHSLRAAFPDAPPAPRHPGRRQFAFSPDGSLLAGLAGAGLVVWDAATGIARHRLTPGGTAKGRSPAGYGCLAFSPCGRHLAAGGPRRVALIDPASGLTRVEYDWKFGTATGLAFSPDGLMLAGCFSGRKVVAFDIED